MAAPDSNTPGDIPDNQAFVPYRWPDGAFTVSVPEGWARGTDGAATVFTDKFNSVRVETAPMPAAPDVAFANTVELPRLQIVVPGFRAGQISVEQRKAGPVVLLRYSANSPQDPVTGKSVANSVERYAFWRGGTEVVLTLSAPQGADNVDPWRTITDSLRWA
jgi:hypothetical protein